MTVPTALPGPRVNRTRAGGIGLADDLAGADIIVAAGDFTGGTPEDEFNLTAHGLVTGDYIWLLYKSAIGVVTGVVGTGFRAKIVDANSFQITNLAGTVIENTADGTAVFLKGGHRTPDSLVQTVILPALIVANGVFTGGTTEDEFIPTAATGYHGLAETNTLKLLYKAAAGVLTGIAADTTVFAKSVRATGAVTDGFECAATSGGADIENTANGLAIFVKTS
jgi:hypothetical protein